MYYDIIFKIFFNYMINKANLYYLHYFFDLIAIYIRMAAAPKTMRNDEIIVMRAERFIAAP